MSTVRPICKSICASTGKPCTHRVKADKEYCGKHEAVEKWKAECKIKIEKEARQAWIKYGKDGLTWEDLPDDKKHQICEVSEGQVDISTWCIKSRVESMVITIDREERERERQRMRKIQYEERKKMMLDRQKREMERLQGLGLLPSSTKTSTITSTKPHNESIWTKYRAGWSRDYRKINRGPVDWWSIDRGIGYKLGGSPALTKYMSHRDKQIAALLRRGIVCK